MPVAAVLLTYALATVRIVGLIRSDTITNPARTALLSRLDEKKPMHRAIAEWTACPWCSSIAVGAGVATVAYYWPTRPWTLIPALGLAYSQVVGMLADVGRT